MRIQFVPILFVAAYLTAIAALGQGSAGKAAAPDDLANPPEVASVGGVLDVTLKAAINPATGGPGIEYDGAFVPPTLRVNPGDTIDITYINDLPASRRGPENDASLHFHGLSTSPNPPADDSIDMLALPGQTLHYSVPVPATQPPGLYWYHSHSMESNWQLYNGMSGAIIVNGIGSFAPETVGLPERIIVLRNLIAHPKYDDVAGTSSTAPQASPTPASADTTCSQPWGITGEYTTINGYRAGLRQIVLPPGQRQLWRVVNASADGFYDVKIDGEKLHVVAIDGVPLTAYPGAVEETVSHLVIPPSGRAEFIVTGTGAPAAFRTTCTDTGPAGDPNPAQVLAKVSATGEAVGLPKIASADSTPSDPGTYEERMAAPARERTVKFTENGDGTEFYLNGRQYHPGTGPMFTVASGTVERWTLVNASGEVHVFHLHQVHFIVEDVNGVAQPAYWRDTVTLPYQSAQRGPSVTHVLVDFRDPEVRGTFLFHCHLEEHSDDGMMASIRVR
jgi:suppressor of ftsI